MHDSINHFLLSVLSFNRGTEDRGRLDNQDFSFVAGYNFMYRQERKSHSEATTTRKGAATPNDILPKNQNTDAPIS
jgi:hypothetical protein